MNFNYFTTTKIKIKYTKKGRRRKHNKKTTTNNNYLCDGNVWKWTVLQTFHAHLLSLFPG
jgi:hypothetical protein